MKHGMSYNVRTGVVHVYPSADAEDPDILEHATDGQACWCQPTLEQVGIDGLIVIHRRTLDSPARETES